jgi:hypothetical protein
VTVSRSQLVTTSFSSVLKFIHTFFAAPSPEGRGNARKTSSAFANWL